MKKDSGIRKISLRTPEMEKKYEDYKKDFFPQYRTFDDWGMRCIEEYDKWVLIENLFPMDLIAKTHHLLIPKRIFSNSWEADREEMEELDRIKRKLQSVYDMFIENTHRKKTVSRHFHLHCVELKEVE